jgi:Protein of unknown function (DUF3102)
MTSLAAHDTTRNSLDFSRSNSLTDLVARINAEHEAAGSALKRSLQHAMAAGDLLREAKAQLSHGQWLPWLKMHCNIPERTARLYMRLAQNRREIGNVADLTVRGAVALLASPPDSFATKAAESEIETLDLAAAELASAEKAKRMNAYREASAALEQIIELSANTSDIGRSVWDRLGDQLMAAIAHCTETLRAGFEEPFAPCVAATAAMFDARNIAFEMLRLVRDDEGASGHQPLLIAEGSAS